MSSRIGNVNEKVNEALVLPLTDLIAMVSLSNQALTYSDSLDFSDKVTTVDYAESFDELCKCEMEHK